MVLELSQQLIEQTPALIDLAVPLGCACAGAGEHALRGKPRSGLLLLEPPRARQKVLDPSLQIDVSLPFVDACAHHAEPEETPAPLEVHAAADTIAPVVEPERIVHADVVAYAEHSTDMMPRHRATVFRAAASAPRVTTESGELVPRAALSAIRRALARMAARKARRQPKLERGRRDHAIEPRDPLNRASARTPRSLAISAVDLPRPAPPPPPSRHRPRTMLGL